MNRLFYFYVRGRYYSGDRNRARRRRCGDRAASAVLTRKISRQESSFGRMERMADSNPIAFTMARFATRRASGSWMKCLLTIMRNPRSYTGEDVVEIHGHGGAFISRRILGLVLAQGARQAERGEFTKRAFLNGRLDLTQAEGVLDLIRARTDKGADLALHQAGGELSKWVARPARRPARSSGSSGSCHRFSG